jgi:Xaa-Pro dipeptidase
MSLKVPKEELKARMNRFRERMDDKHPDWELSVFFGNINLYYYTGTIQNSILVIPRNEDPILWVKRSYERALDESEFPLIEEMNSFRDAAKRYHKIPENIYLESEILPVAHYKRFSKYFPSEKVISLDYDAAMVRAVKSQYELSLMKRSGEIHRSTLEESVPDMLSEGMNEVELAVELYAHLVRKGHHGTARFGAFNSEMILGQLGFGESSLYPTYFDGPGGCLGMSPAVPLMGNRERQLKKGDLVFIDIGCGVQGYHTDKTMTYMFKEQIPGEAVKEHYNCVEIQQKVADLLKPGVIPSEIYDTVMSSLEPGFLKDFMGFGTRTVKFLGHGVGLLIDEMPVLARGFDEPLQEGMTFAVEPKKGIKDVGMVGTEDTFIVTTSGGKSITGSHKGLIMIE